MDAPPKLFDLAFEFVVNWFTTGRFPTKVIPPNTTLSDQIFEAVWRVRDCYDDHSKALIKEFKPTKLELNLEYCRYGSFLEIRKLKLTELIIRNFRRISRHVFRIAGAPQRDHFLIAHFLQDILSWESMNELRVLDIDEYVPLGDNWMKEVSTMFPKLEVLIINKQEFREEDFAISCKNLQNLHTLGIGHDKLKNLNGISKLTNLKNLIIDGFDFGSEKDVEELFELKNLKTLSFWHNPLLEWKYDFLFAKPFPELTHLNIGWAQANDDFLKRILPKLPKLQVVQANETEIHENAAPPSVTVYASTDLNAIMKSLAYFRITKDRHGTLWTIDKFWKIYENCWSVQSTCTPEQLTVCVNEVEALINTFKFDERVMKSVNFCVGVFACFAMGDGHFNVNKLKIVSLLLQNLKNHLKNRTSPDHEIFEDIWFDIDKLMGNTENLNTDKVAAMAMESIVYCGGNVQCCAKLLEKILDKLNLSLEYYKKISLRKLHERLNEIHKNTRLLAENRASAGEVLKYIERFM